MFEVILVMLGVLVLCVLQLLWFTYSYGAARIVKEISKVYPSLGREILKDLVIVSRSKRYTINQRLTAKQIVMATKEIS